MKNKYLFTVILTTICLLIFVIKAFGQDGYKTESFKVNKEGKLKVELSGGDIQIRTWEKNEIKIVYEEEENDYYDGVKIYRDGNDITIRSSDYVDFEITCPPEFNLSLSTSGGNIGILNSIKGEVVVSTAGGDIMLNDIYGKLSANTAGGDIKCENVQGEAKLSSGGGDIVVGSVEGECKASTGGGDVRVKNVTKLLAISTGGGNVECSNIGGNTDISTGGGEISVDNISGVLTVTTGGGNVSARSIKKGGSVTTGGGDVTLKNLSGNIRVTSGAGNIVTEFVSVGTKKSKLVTGYGDITVYIPENAKVTIYAKVKWSEGNVWTLDKKEISEMIKSDFKSSDEQLQFNQKRGEYDAVYNINGGGTEIELETSIGYIEIKKLGR
jgi:hypothetical protein